MRVYTVDTLYGDHLYCCIGDPGSWSENIITADIADVCNDDEEIRDIIMNELDESEDVIKELLHEYGLN